MVFITNIGSNITYVARGPRISGPCLAKWRAWIPVCRSPSNPRKWIMFKSFGGRRETARWKIPYPKLTAAIKRRIVCGGRRLKNKISKNSTSKTRWAIIIAYFKYKLVKPYSAAVNSCKLMSPLVLFGSVLLDVGSFLRIETKFNGTLKLWDSLDPTPL